MVSDASELPENALYHCIVLNVRSHAYMKSTKYISYVNESSQLSSITAMNITGEKENTGS